MTRIDHFSGPWTADYMVDVAGAFKRSRLSHSCRYACAAPKSESSFDVAM